MDSKVIIEFVYMFVIDLAFLLALVILMLPLGIWRQAAFAVMKRNFSGYFSNPTGYVFLCLFVLLTSFAAFWPHEFFTTNLANFDQLNRFLPFIMLIFIPAITMSIWAEERRQGTDELLLTLPARDFDIVIGKYFAAVFVFSVSLLFSQLSNYAVLLAMTGGSLDTQLLFSTYVGYWFMGVAMLSLGMVASFLTSNLTVGFIFGAAFNAPLAFFSSADVILSDNAWIQRLFEWSLLQRFEPFGRGLISPSSIVYFLGIVCLGIYFSLILIGRRHWVGGRDGQSMFWHYFMRAGFLVVGVIASVLVVQHSPLNRMRTDVSNGKVSTLSPTSHGLLTALANEKSAEGEPVPSTITVDAFVSGNLPTEFVQASYDLINLLREFDVLGGNRVKVNLQQSIEPFSEEAILAEKRFGIRPQRITSQSRGAVREEETILGVAISSGRQRIVIPFIPYGAPVEYELIRAIRQVANPGKKKLGIVRTDAYVMGASLNVINKEGETQPVRIPMLEVFGELQNEYELEEISAATPIPVWLENDQGNPTTRRYDAIIAVQPSKMTTTELQNLIAAIRLGQPTLIFEDAVPNSEEFPTIWGTFFPRRISRPTTEAGDFQKMLDLIQLDVDRVKKEGLWFPVLLAKSPAANPYPKDIGLNMPERLVIREAESDYEMKFSKENPATASITEIEMDLVTPIKPRPDSKLEFVELINSGRVGTISSYEFLKYPPEQREQFQTSPDFSYAVAAHIHGAKLGDVETDADEVRKPDDQKVNVVWVSDVDMLSNRFVTLRDFPYSGDGIEYRFQNVALVQNLVDFLAGESTWFGLRNRQQKQSTLRVVEQAVAEAMQTEFEVTQKFDKESMQTQMALRAKLEKSLGPLSKEIKAMEDQGQLNEEYRLKKQTLEAMQREELQPAIAQLEQMDIDRQETLRRIRLDAELKIQKTQRNFKLAAVVIPPIPPLLMGLIVWTRRRLLEREGISKARRLK